MAMKTTQGWGWLAAGVLALGLNGFYHDGGAAWAHRIANQVVQQSEALVEMASARSDRFMERTSLVVAHNETTSCRLATALARVQTKVARTQNGMAQFEAMSARQEVALARMEADRARIQAEVAVRLAPVAFDSVTIPEVACPRVRVSVPRVSVPRVPVVRIPAPVVQVEMAGDGPI
jgi:capsule polysaccharide export protein KpsE/RkpR